ncbi:MAG: RodZ domain-containing protein [Betaproteobacteria bacterium]
MNSDEIPDAPETEAAAAPSAGTVLAHARHAAGLTIEDVSMQLKLAPRQVVAIERDDFANLPGRTFIRGFVRNYARLLHIDVDAVLAALPGELGTAPERPSLAATSRAIGEMPTERSSRPAIARWAIPLVLVAIVAAAAFYEFARPPASRAPAAPASLPGVPLVNPVQPSSPPPTGGSPAEVSAPSTGAAPGTLSTPSAPPVATGALPANTGAVESTQPPRAPQDAAANPSQASAPANGTPQLMLRFRGTSWVEVRDRSGGIVLSMTGSDGATREIAVTTPAEVTVGNAAVVDAAWRGRPLDVAALSRQNVARIRLD